MRSQSNQASGTQATARIRRAVALALSSGSSALVLAVIAGGAAFSANAQEQAAAAEIGVEEVVVTARRREERIQDVPVAVSAISEEMLQSANVPTTNELVQFVPNVILDNIETGTPNGGAFSIRGISYQDVEKTFDPTVLTMVDGIVRGSGTGATMSLLDVRSIEVLRGPQGTLFGKNAVGGIINITRRAPETASTFGAVEAEGGNYGTNNFNGYVNLGADKFGVKLTAARLDHDGYFPNDTRHVDEGYKTEEDYGAAILWQPVDEFSLKLSYDYKHIDGSPAPTMNISDRSDAYPVGDLLCSAYGQCARGPMRTQNGDPFTGSGSRPAVMEYKENFGVVEANWDFAQDYRATYLYGYLSGHDNIAFDSDGSPADFFSVRRWGDYKQESHELRVTRSGEKFNWQLGGYLWDSESSDSNIYELSNFFDYFEGSSESTSVFGEGDLRFAEKWVATAGFRWIDETKKIYKEALASRGERTDSDTIYRAGLRYEVNPDLMAYFTFSQGWRSGGFSARANTVEVLESGQDPEKLDNYELGIKSDWLDRRLRLNATLFHMIYNDMQIESNIPCESCSTGQQTAVLNVGKATIDGVELEFTGNPIENWTLTGSVGLLDAVYDEFFTDLLGTGTPADYSDLPLRRAPETTWALQSNYEIQMPVGNLSWFIGYNWTSDYAATIDDHPGTHVDSFGILNSSLTYQYSDALEFSLYGNNLTDEGAFTHVYAVGGTAEGGSLWKFANPRVPMTYGLKVIYRFGK